MKLFFFITVLLTIGASGVYSQACHLREVDLCMAVGMLHYQSNGVPADDDAVNEWCETMKEVQECGGNFTSKCLSPVQREVLQLLSGSEDEASELCVHGSEIRSRYLKYSECLAEGAEMEEFKNYLKDLQVVIQTMFDVPYKKRFPLMCCGFRRFRTSTDAMTERRCGAEAVEISHTIMRMVTTELPSVICQEYDPESDKCRGLLPSPGTPAKKSENSSQLSKLLDTVFGNN